MAFGCDKHPMKNALSSIIKNYPNTTEKGGAKAKLLITASRPSVYSGYVASSYGMSQVTKYTSINEIAYFTGVTKKTLSVTQRP